ncbi:acyltransferase [Flavihumibacter sp. UBA7668]|uniref:acyltransferase n=1 Tax=Flavihumibacter sp. UBA7668 TaxID=1946542 RepID=UPI0025C079F2|nr:acyltransferase [Flavihumibacter sp. UBA7668]
MFSRLYDYYKRKFWNGVRYAKSVGVKVGDNCKISGANFGSEPYLVTIGNNVQITNEVKFFTHGGGWVFRKKHPSFDSFGKIVIGNNVYIGNNTLLLPGVSVGDNVVIGAGSVITKSIPSNSVVAGNPARIITDIDSLEIRMLKYNVQSKGMGYREKKKYLLGLDESRFIKKELL